MALNCTVVPTGADGVAGLRVMEVSAAALTCKVIAGERMLPWAAVIVVVPVATEATRPLEPAALLMVAVDSDEEDHVAELVRS